MAEHVKAANNIASGVAVLHKNCVLLAKRCNKCHITGGPIPFAGYWSIFAGSVDPGETPKECAGRELYEESNIFIDFKYIKFKKSFVDKYSTFHFHVYKSKEMLFPKLSKEHTEFGWFKIKDLHSFSGPIDPNIVSCITSV